MHRITIRISGGIEYEEAVDLAEAEALPQFMRLKEVLGQGVKPKKVAKRPTKPEGETDPASTTEAAE
ncbi:MAG: hypothetical protein L6R30_06500 [Thermoanaerobaculia bacterium]|nr:hypothetical protein [Thermoanaerobaculia bacterium]